VLCLTAWELQQGAGLRNCWNKFHSTLVLVVVVVVVVLACCPVKMLSYRNAAFRCVFQQEMHKDACAAEPSGAAYGVL